jgi:ABC-type multidrug transport system ATPase subunit/CRP-like cAMP-binding protein
VTDQIASTPATKHSVATVDTEWGEQGRRLHFLRNIELFASCSHSVLGHVATALTPVSLPQGTVVCREGDPGDAMFLVREGVLSVTTRVGEENVELDRFGPGQFFGEQAVLSHGRHPTTVRAGSTVSLWSLTAADFDELLAREPELARRVAAVVRARQREKTRTVFEVERHNLAALAGDKASIRLGRDPDNDIVFDSPLVSRHHAILERAGDAYRLRDLGSANGTSVNGVRIQITELSDGDEIGVATERFIFDRREITRVLEPRGVAIDVTDLSRLVKDGKQILSGVTLSILPGEFVAVVGGSGAGKSTLMDAISGVHPATSGSVRYNGRDYYANIDLYRNVLGYVPQDDIIHTALSVRRTLYHAARLRLPKDTSRETLDNVVNEAIAQLGLENQAETRVKELSGGQRKRSSIGVELLTRPRVFFLDEPTSGLDPATETHMMQIMRKLADDGSTMLVTTHATKNVLMCDKVVFLARGGYLAFAGSPQRALQYFGSQDFDEIYLRLESEASPGEWAERFRASADYQALVERQTRLPTERAAGAERGASRRRGLRHAHPTHPLHQFGVLTYRSLDMLLRYPANLFALFVQPLLITFLLLLLFKSGAFTPGAANPIPAVQIVYIICFAMFFFGVTFGLNEICGEFTIFSRERMVNLGIGPYVLSKVAVLGPFLLLAELVIIVALRATGRLPADGIDTYAAFFLTLALSELAGFAIALLASSVVPDSDAAARVLPAILLPQVFFSGGFVAAKSMESLGRWIGTFTVARWSFEGAGHTLNVNGLVSKVVPATNNPLLQQYGDAFSRNIWQNWVIISAYIVIPLVLTCVVLARRSAR